MRIFEIGTGYTSIPAKISAATEIIIEELAKSFMNLHMPVEIIDLVVENRPENELKIHEIKVPKVFIGTDIELGFRHKIKRIVYSVCLARELGRIIAKSKEKIVLHFHNQYNLFFFLMLNSKCKNKNVVIAYTNHSGIWNQSWDKVRNTIYKKYFQEMICMKHCDVLFALNVQTKNNVVRNLKVSPSNVSIIKNGVNTNIYVPLDASIVEGIKKKWGVAGKKVLLQIGSVNENKGQLSVITGLTPLLKQCDNFIYAYAGGIVSQEYKKKIDEYIDKTSISDKVRYLGMIEPGLQLNELYNIAEATIVSSGFESFSLVTIESLSAGTPVLINESVPFSEGNGCIAYTNETIADIVSRVVLGVGMKSEMSKLAREYAESNYAWEHVAKQYIDIFYKTKGRN